MKGRGGLEGWRWIIIIEGILTALVGILAYFVLPETIDKATFLSPEERHLGLQRILADRPVTIDKSGRMVSVDEQFKWKYVIAPLISPMVSAFVDCSSVIADDFQTWLSAGAYFAILTALYSFSLFVPTM
jgi:uncharacterized membrane protein YagU involved in acid resistance